VYLTLIKSLIKFLMNFFNILNLVFLTKIAIYNIIFLQLFICDSFATFNIFVINFQIKILYNLI